MQRFKKTNNRPFLPVDNKALLEASSGEPDHLLERVLHQVGLRRVVDLAPFHGYTVRRDVVVHLNRTGVDFCPRSIQLDKKFLL